MAPKKKQPKNAFYFFAMDFRDEKARQGITYPNFREIFDAAGPEWQYLNKHEKDRYEEIAKDHKLTEQHTIKKYTTTGKTFDQVDAELRERLQQEARMEEEIINTVAVLDKKGLQVKTFYFMHVNYYCRVEEKQFIPCELAICQFNFIKGAHSFYHTLINPGDIPLGYAFDAKKRSEETHQISFPPPSSAERNYSRILQNILKFIKDDEEHGKLPPVYTYGTDGTFEAVKDVLDALCYYEETEQRFRVYPLQKLFFELRNRAGDLGNKESKAFPAESLAARELDKNLYSFTPGICCQMHDGTDASQYCSLSLVRRWSFIIADYCCKDLGIELAPGQHIPPPINQTQLRHTAVNVLMPKEDKKSTEPIIPTLIDYSGTRPRAVPARKVSENVKKSTEPTISTISNYSRVNSYVGAAGAVAAVEVSENVKKSTEPAISSITNYSSINSNVGAAGAVATVELGDSSSSVGRGRPAASSSFSGAVRKPKSVSLALQNCQLPVMSSQQDFPAIGGLAMQNRQPPVVLSEHDFPAIGAHSTSNNSFLGEAPLKVAGRGISNGTVGGVPSRGRGIYGLMGKK